MSAYGKPVYKFLFSCRKISVQPVFFSVSYKQDLNYSMSKTLEHQNMMMHNPQGQVRLFKTGMERLFIQGSRGWGKSKTSELAKSHSWDETGRVPRAGCHSVTSDSATLWTGPARLLCPWNSLGKNTGVGCHFLLQQIILTQGLNPHLFCLLHWQVGSLPLSHLGGWQDAANNPGGLWHRFPNIWAFGHHVDMTKMSQSKLSPLPAHVLKVKIPPPYFRSDTMKTNEDIMATSRLCSPTSLKIWPILLSRVLAGACWNIINTAGIFLSKQKVTLNGGEDLTAVHGKEERNQPLHCLWVTDIVLPRYSKPGRLYPSHSIWSWNCGWERVYFRKQTCSGLTVQ